jgi:hypothetical protein
MLSVTGNNLTKPPPHVGLLVARTFRQALRSDATSVFLIFGRPCPQGCMRGLLHR